MGPPDESPPAASAPAIAYATAPPDRVQGIRITRDPHHLEVIVPPLVNWRALPIGLRVAIPTFLTIIVARAWAVFVTNRHSWRLAIGDALFYGTLLILITAFAYLRLHRWLRFVVTADRFFLIRRVGGLPETTTSWPRDRVLAANTSSESGKLLLRILGQDTLEIFVSKDLKTSRWVAQTLDTALHETFEPVRPAAINPTLPSRAPTP